MDERSDFAATLALGVADASTLLKAADKLPLDALWIQAQRAGDPVLLGLLEPWTTEIEQTAGRAFQPFPDMLGTSSYCGLWTCEGADTIPLSLPVVP